MLPIIRTLVIALALFGCSKKQDQTTPPPSGGGAAAGAAGGTCEAISPDKPLTPDQCQCHGGRVNASKGGEQAHCDAGEQELGNVSMGIEGGWCCAKPGDGAAKAAQ